MERKHGQTTYFIEGEGFVGERAMREDAKPLAGVLGDSGQPDAEHDAERAFRFTRMFNNLPAARPDPEALIELGRAMDDTPNFKDHLTLPAGFTYLGQFIDHDITLDPTALVPTEQLEPEEIMQGRSPALDLDNVYGRGPEKETKRLYEDDKVRLRIGKTSGLGPQGSEPETQELPNDLPRGDDSANPHLATIGDHRNDENLVVAQTHLAFLKLHNVVVAQLAETGLTGAALFERARRTVTMHYQWIVLHDFVERIVEPGTVNEVISNGRRFFQTTPGEIPAMPIEFSVAAYRFGHSMIRDSYSWNRNFPSASLVQLFEFSGLSGHGDIIGAIFPNLPANWPIDWRRFYDFSGVRGVDAPPKMNTTRSIDTGLAMTLRELPEFRDEPDRNKAALAVRNLARGRVLGLPTGQAVAEAIGAPVMTPAQVNGVHAAVLQKHGFDEQTPLWYYILREAEVFHNGERLGPVGSRLIVETFVGLVQGSKHSILSDANRYWRPTLPSVRPGHFTMVDLLLLVNDLNPLGAERQTLPPPVPAPAREHTVQPGETLRSIAARFLGDERRWQVIFQANRDVISNADLIRPGMKLTIPNV